ncbi:hypothetical protein [Clostridium cellulovorans]|uniref:Uncharacterized protein n=1 Tax=Clostridium cellulovorans (strain ATCC 35296 / DSM 3052 / OCM 3 / 743B) TaxID=573061 RepID=D9SLN7_CLOC7|nr:hypothetical protein [Clostridium cellulovorans]ADL53674.1 hypothetical protein Clocel_4011 [Clostridium cellulovorans 743B]
MVTFKLLYKAEKEIRYEYFPENDKNSSAGIIGINIDEEKIFIVQPAERDSLRHIPASELNELRDSINEMRKENGEPPLTEAELPTATEDDVFYYYASHAMSKIAEAYDEGTVLEQGTVAWY